jgi:hypothetical protein
MPFHFEFSVEAEWVTAKKDWQEAKRKYKAHQQRKNSKPEGAPEQPSDEDNIYLPDMDEMRCILYFHGGGYYFGSVDQERYGENEPANNRRLINMSSADTLFNDLPAKLMGGCSLLTIDWRRSIRFRVRFKTPLPHVRMYFFVAN